MWQETSNFQQASLDGGKWIENKTIKIMAVRLKRFADGEHAFVAKDCHKNKRKLVASRVDKRDPALRNLTDGLEHNGMQMIVDGCALYWFMVEDNNDIEYYRAMNEVECVFSNDAFERFKKSIRYFQGAQYVEKCIEFADQFEIKDQNRKIDYTIDG